MGKTITASQMLSAGRKRPPSPAETGTEVLHNGTSSSVVDQSSKQLDDQVSERLSNGTSSSVVDQSSKQLDDQVSERLSNGTSTGVVGQSSKQLDDQASERLSNGTSTGVVGQSSKQLDDQASERLSNGTSTGVVGQSSKQLDDQASERLSVTSRTLPSNDQPGTASHPTNTATFQRVTVFLTPTQRQWLKLTAKHLPDGLSGSDIVRLALSRLAHDVTSGFDLITELANQAHLDAEVFSGRRNRGLPPRVDTSA